MPGMEIYLQYEQMEMYDDYDYPLSDALLDGLEPQQVINDDEYAEVPFVNPARCVRSSRS